MANVKKSIKFEAMSNKLHKNEKRKKTNTGRILIIDYETSIPSSTMQSEAVIIIFKRMMDTLRRFKE